MNHRTFAGRGLALLCLLGCVLLLSVAAAAQQGSLGAGEAPDGEAAASEAGTGEPGTGEPGAANDGGLLDLFGDDGESGRVVLGVREEVVVAPPTGGPRVEVVAKVDTGADRTSIDDDLARELGLDLDNAETVRVRSSLGVGERPLVKIRVQLAGRTLETEVSVQEREDLSTPMILGRTDLDGFLVDVGRDRITEPGEMPRRESEDGDEETGAAARVSEFIDGAQDLFGGSPFLLQAFTLLALVPLASVIVVSFRTFVGLKTFGIFTPVILALSFLQTGVWLGLLMFAGVVGAGLLFQPLLRKLKLSRTSRLGVLLAVVVLVILSFQHVFEATGIEAALAAAFPSVITVAMIEQLWSTWEQESLKRALQVSGFTAIVIAAASGLLLLEPVQDMARQYPFWMAGVSVLLCVAIGRYRGLRISELIRFDPVAE